MKTDLTSFIKIYCIKSPAASVPVVELWRAFRRWLGDDARNWTRSQFVGLLPFPLATENNRTVAVGIGLPMLVADGQIYRLA